MSRKPHPRACQQVDRAGSRRVAISFPLDSTYGRQKLLGVLAYARRNPGWQIELVGSQPWLEEVNLSDWRGDGILCECYSVGEVRSIRAKRIPAVNTSAALAASKMPTVSIDHESIGELVARHLISSGYRDFLFFGREDLPYTQIRWRGFQRTMRQGGFRVRASWLSPEVNEKQLMNASLYREDLEAISRPCGVFGATDRIAFGVLQAAKSLRLSVPNEVAVVGCNNDEILCALATPPLSSVDESATAVGYHAAARLDSLMGRRDENDLETPLAPAGLRVRESSDVLCVSDSALATAVRFIREHKHEFIGVNDVLKTTHLSRRTLEGLFRRGVGRGIYQEICRTHIEHAKELLRDTDYSLLEIARQSGFKSLNRFEVAFAKLCGVSPSSYRRRHVATPR